MDVRVPGERDDRVDALGRQRVVEVRAPVLVDLHVVWEEAEVVEHDPQLREPHGQLEQTGQLVGRRGRSTGRGRCPTPHRSASSAPSSVIVRTPSKAKRSRRAGRSCRPTAIAAKRGPSTDATYSSWSSSPTSTAWSTPWESISVEQLLDRRLALGGHERVGLAPVQRPRGGRRAGGRRRSPAAHRTILSAPSARSSGRPTQASPLIVCWTAHARAAVVDRGGQRVARQQPGDQRAERGVAAAEAVDDPRRVRGAEQHLVRGDGRDRDDRRARPRARSRAARPPRGRSGRASPAPARPARPLRPAAARDRARRPAARRRRRASRAGPAPPRSHVHWRERWLTSKNVRTPRARALAEQPARGRAAAPGPMPQVMPLVSAAAAPSSAASQSNASPSRRARPLSPRS